VPTKTQAPDPVGRVGGVILDQDEMDADRKCLAARLGSFPPPATITLADVVGCLTELIACDCPQCGRPRSQSAEIEGLTIYVKSNCGHTELILNGRVRLWARRKWKRMVQDKIVAIVRVCGPLFHNEIKRKAGVKNIDRALRALRDEGRIELRYDYSYTLPGAPPPEPKPPSVPLQQLAEQTILRLLSDRRVWRREEMLKRLGDDPYCGATIFEKAINALMARRRVKRARSGAFCLFDVHPRPRDRLAGRAAKIYDLLDDGMVHSRDELLSQIKATKPRASRQAIHATLKALSRDGHIEDLSGHRYKRISPSSQEPSTAG
jgi:hypothetical protein